MLRHFLMFVCEATVMRISMLTKAVDALNVRHARASSEADEASNGHIPTQQQKGSHAGNFHVNAFD